MVGILSTRVLEPMITAHGVWEMFGNAHWDVASSSLARSLFDRISTDDNSIQGVKMLVETSQCHSVISLARSLYG